MKSTMMDTPLLLSTVLRHGSEVHSDSEVMTATADGVRRASYGEVGERAARLARGLRQLGITGDQRVGTFMWNNQEHLEAYLAVPSMGAVLHTLNIRLFPDQLVYIANHAQDQVIIIDGSLVPLYEPHLERCKPAHTLIVTGDADVSGLEGRGKDVLRYEDVLAGSSPDFTWPDLDERSAAAMCYTSGTTGDPKGVAYSHRSTVLHSYAVMSGEALGLTTAHRALPVVPMFHAMAWGITYAAFASGAALVLPDRWLQPEPLAALIEAERPDCGGAVPTIWNDLLQWLRANPGHDVSSLKRVLCGGSAVPDSLMRACAEELGIQLVQAWGMTETSPLGSISNPPAGADEQTTWRYKNTAGRVAFCVEARIVDDAGEVQPRDGDSVGELEVRGPWVTASYYGDDDPARFDDGWLRTGDVGHIDALGYITLTDRAKDVIKSGGEWISSVDLENTLIGHPEVVECAVVAVPDERWQERPLAAVVLVEGSTADAKVLQEWLGERVVRWWVPERWAFVSAVPRNSVGKYDKKVIRRSYADGELEVTTLP